MNAPQSQPEEPPRGIAGFDAWYRGDTGAMGRTGQDGAAGIVLDRMPWDIGEPQPVVRELEAGGHISSEVLDVGCGLGENTVFLAGRGYRVLGLDGSPTAIERASARAVERRVDARFAVADATELPGYNGRFATVVDSALYHCLTEPERIAYLGALHRACRPGALLHIVCFSDAVPESFPGPYRISEAHLREALTGNWKLRSLRAATYTTAFTRDNLERAPAPLQEAVRAAGMGYDDRSRLLIPSWLATAERQ